jgi:hypothetical protein
MHTDIKPPSSDDVDFKAVTLRLAPAAMEKISTRQERTGLNRAKTISMILAAGHAALDGNTALAKQWQDYQNALAAEKAKQPPKA